MTYVEDYRERAVKSLWHVLIATVGIYELRSHKTKISRVLACGLIAFHADAAICDALDAPTLFQRLLYAIGGRRQPSPVVSTIITEIM